ncbi:autotransporter domain-containing protein [Oxalobacter aliiformigenes]|uniref:Autotransporter domain-containing protein n=1 Tax=Oxalobacter aliiformigenes TaxID=2946593 RepID=A0ABY7JF68_9BURK|nr:autotransporter domain-containing protein [Oxalobacter aliiformigenes]WAV92577.1 autotransporter domain-containing protein [Oxalobacter aliiformigenes]WAV95915.1 autotransporter domain-containing protein [Oxalobacter aliiformigenes]WAV96293.1 autotransporter domain-containing protein [Oxalobacter aliiformigenes]
MNRPLSKKPDRSGKRPSSLRRLFVPTLLCLALFPASFALAGKSGGQDIPNTNIPSINDYGNIDSLTGNNVRVTGEKISGNVFGAYTTDNPAAISGNNVTVTDHSTVKQNIYGGHAKVSGNEASAIANSNHVDVSNSRVENSSSFISAGNIFGGRAYVKGSQTAAAEANNNSVTVSDHSTVDEDIRGGRAYVEGNQTAAAEANNNSVTVSGGSEVKYIYGGSTYAEGNQTAAAEANGNSVTVSGGSEVKYIYGGSTYAEGNQTTAIANNNSVDVSGSETKGTKVNGNIYGGYTEAHNSKKATAVANGNSVDVSGSETKKTEVNGDILGGRVYARASQNTGATASDNRVDVFSSTVNNIHGGYIEAYDSKVTATASNNSVTVSDSTVNNSIYGGNVFVSGSDVTATTTNNNSVTVSGSTVNGDILGGRAETARSEKNTTEASDNRVTVSSSPTINASVYGGKASAYAGQNAEVIANRNTVTVSGSKVNGRDHNIYGGYAYASGDQTVAAEANGNNVTVSDHFTVENNIYGGHAYASGNQTATAKANNNNVTVSGSETKVKNIYGGATKVYAVNSQIATAKANNNSVTASGVSEVKNIYGGYASASGAQTATSEANGNNVTVSGYSTVEGYYYGGKAEAFGNQTAAAEASGNSVTVSNGSTVNSDIFGGMAMASGAQTATAKANNNNVTVSNGSTVNSDIFGGYANAYDGTQNTEYATGNTVTIDSATVESGNTIAGGAVWIDNNDDTHIATGNTVTLTGNYTIDGTSLYGGYDEGNEDFASGPNDDLFSGNTLNLDARKVATTSVRQVANFETINIRAGNINNGDTVLQTSGTILGNGKTGAEAKGTTVNLISIENPSLKAGDKLTLITDTEGTLANDKEKQFVQKGENFAVGYDAQIEKESGNVIASIEGNKLNPETKILNENRAASLAFINSGTDLLLDTDIGKGKNIFGAIRGGHSRYETGSSVEIDGVNLITGFAHTQTGENGDITGGAFIEAGWGDTATHNTLGGKRLKGNGNTHYYGAGILGRYEWTRGAVKGLYADAAVRAGKLSSDYHNNDATNIKGQRVSYDIDSTYYAAHLGIGYQWDMTNALRLDTSAQYMWAHVDSENTTILGERYHLDAMDSHRTRVGVKLNYTAEPQYTPYIGIAWEHEFDGKAKSSVEGYAIDEADLGGSSGIVTLGVDFKPSENSPLTLEAGVTGYVGQHEGVAGQFRMQYTF